MFIVYLQLLLKKIVLNTICEIQHMIHSFYFLESNFKYDFEIA